MSEKEILKKFIRKNKEEELDSKINDTVMQSKELIKTSKIKTISLIAFLLPPIFMSLVSLVHVYEFFLITNSSTWSFIIACTFELASISSLVALVVLEKIDKGALWTLFFILAIFQIIGNVYASFANIDTLLLKQFTDMFWATNSIGAQRTIAIIQGAALPILSLSLLKIAVDYIDFDNLDRL